jgi:ATP-binding cassette subfamily B protein
VTTHDDHLDEAANRIDLALWKRLFRYTRPYRGTLALLATLGAATAGIDVAIPYVTGRVVDAVTRDGDAAALVRYAWIYGLLVLALSACIWGFIRSAGRIRTHISHDIRRDGFVRLQELSFSYFDHRPVGWLMARMTSDCERLSNILAWGILDLFWGFTLMFGIGGVMIWIDVRLGLVVLSVIPVLVVVSAIFRKKILHSSREVRKTNSRITAAYNEGIMGVRTSKVFVRDDENLREFRDLSGTMYAASVRNRLHSALYLPLVLTLGSVATGLALAAGGLDVTAGRISLGVLVTFLAYTQRFFEPINELAAWFAELQMAQAAAERVLGLIATEPEIRDSAAVRARLAEPGPRGDGVAADGGPARIRRIEFERVGFHYKKGEPVLQDFDLVVEAGETVALVGATGGGKTTIVNLLCRFYEPTAGRILLDGRDYRERSLHWLQSNLGIVLQTPHLFSGTIMENIRYGKLDATDDEVIAAAKLVGADEFVSAMEHGYLSEVGEGGILLSTGQKQLLSFARAILAAPQILVMDEATSSVDTETEQRIQAGLQRVLKGRTSFVIAHRLSTIRSADRILVIERGRIVEEGGHRDLLARRGRYHDLYVQQNLRDSLRTEW